jgi:ferrous iron transport protein A
MHRHHSQAHRTTLSRNGTRRLSELKSDETAIIQDLLAGAGFRSRLAALGFTPGTRIKMLQNRGHGPIIVTVRDTRIALGRGEACKILVNLE